MNINKMLPLKTLLMLRIISVSFSNAAENQSIDKFQPVYLRDNLLVYNNSEIKLGPLTFYVNGNLNDSVTVYSPYVFNSLTKALNTLNEGTEQNPMTLLIAPHVYWIDNPNDTEIRKATVDKHPYGMIIKNKWLRLSGLNNDPKQIIIACNRGQTMGALGNFTMFKFESTGIWANNITFGNYCNVDLVYPLKPSLNHPKRSEVIVQAQLIHTDADKVFAENCHFVSRLNLSPFANGRRALFYRCHFEMTDDALCRTGVYLNCDFDFYSSKPIYTTNGTGAVFLNSDFKVLNSNKQCFTKFPGQVAVIDCRFHSRNDSLEVNWCSAPDASMRCYAFNITANGKPLHIDAKNKQYTVNLTTHELLNAYRVETDKGIVYNTFNLLRGNDNWDPLNVKDIIDSISQKKGKNLTNIPTQLKIRADYNKIETAKNNAIIKPEFYRHGAFNASRQSLKWSLINSNTEIARMTSYDSICHIEGNNNQNHPEKIIVQVEAENGLVAASEIEIVPPILDPPGFIRKPTLAKNNQNLLRLNYQLDLKGYNDHSLISWYRCSNENGDNPIEVAVSRNNNPMQKYKLTANDNGYYIMAKIEAKHIRSGTAAAFNVVYPQKIKLKNYGISELNYGFENFSTSTQPQIIQGFWTIDRFRPLDVITHEWETKPDEPYWFYGEGLYGAKGKTGLIQGVKGARMLYTPTGKFYNNMTINLIVAPGKGGSGFGSATSQYMDIFIKYDTRTLTGYGLRIIRTTKFSGTVDVMLMKYTNGASEAISEPVSTNCFQSNCYINLSFTNNTLSAQVNTDAPLNRPKNDQVKSNVILFATVTDNLIGGLGMQHTGSVGTSALVIQELKVKWK